MCVALKRWVKISYSIESVCFYEAVIKLDVIILPDKILRCFHFHVFSLGDPISMPDNKAISFPYDISNTPPWKSIPEKKDAIQHIIMAQKSTISIFSKPDLTYFQS